MATILLNVKVDEKGLQLAKKQLEDVLGGAGGGNRTGTKSATANVDNLRKSYANLLTTIQSTEKYYKKGTFNGIIESATKASKSLQNVSQSGQQGAQVAEYYKRKLIELQRQFAETRQESENMHGSLLEIVKGFAKFQLAAMLVMKPLQLMRGAWEDLNETLVETEKRIVELNRVTNNMANADALYKLAQQYGQTFENVSDITLNFARNGMDWAEALKATEAALLAINVAELDATQASEGMIAIMQQFGYEASELEGIVDKLNITADNAAVTTEKLLTALQRTGSSAKNAKLSLEETVGIITALSEATGRSGENLGTAVNSLIQFSTKASSLETFEKLGGDVAKVVEAYRSGGATVLDIWEELSKVIKNNADYAQGVLGSNFSTSDFESLNEELKESLGESFAETTEIYDTASTFRKNYFIALLNNLDQVQETLDTMNGAQGYSQKENLQYLDTYEAKVNTLQAKWKDIANDEQGLLAMKKGLADIALFLLEVLDSVGGLHTILIALAPMMIGAFGPAMVASIIKMVTALKGATAAATAFQTAMGWIGLAAGLISAVVTGIVKYNKAQEQARDLAVSTWKAEYEHASELATVYDYYTKLSTTADNYSLVEEKLVSLLGEKATALDDLTKGTDEYREAIKNLAEIELKHEYAKQAIALRSAKKNAEKTKLPSMYYLGSEAENGSWTDIGYILDAAGVSYESSIGGYIDTETPFNDYYLSGLKDVKTAEDAVNNLNIYKDTADKLAQAYSKFLSEGDETAANNALALYEKITGVIDKYKQDIEDYEWIQGNLDLIGELEEGLLGVKDTTKETNKNIEQLTEEELNALISKFEELRDVNKELLDLEDARQKIVDAQSKAEEAKAKILEKQNELIKKQQALQDAYQQRTVRVFNARTGQWEQVANQKDIDKAKEDVAKAQLAVEQAQEDYLEAIKNIEEARKDYEKTAYNAMISLLQSGDVTTEEIKALVDTIAKYMPDLASIIKQVLLKQGIDIDKPPEEPTKEGEKPVYDSGGVLRGLGGIKATRRPEVVLDPNMAEKILNPSSNEQFTNFTKSLGILFGASDKMSNFGRGNIVHNIGGNTNNTTNSNNSYVVNGVPFSQQMTETHTLAQLLEIASQLS